MSMNRSASFAGMVCLTLASVLPLACWGADAATKAAVVSKQALTSAEASEAAAPPVKPANATCNTFDHLRFCVRQGVIRPDGNNSYVATVTVSVTIEGTNPPEYRIFFPAGNQKASLDADGVSGWNSDDPSGAKTCNNANDQMCAESESFYTTISSGSSFTFLFKKNADLNTNLALADAHEATLTGRFIVGKKGSAVHSQNFAVEGFPIKVYLASKR